MSSEFDDLQLLARALREGEDGKELRKELARNLRAALKPAADQAKSSIMAMPSHGSRTAPALRSSIAKKIRPEVKLGGRWTGARLKARKTRNVRGFVNAPKRTQMARGWRSPLFGNRDVWVTHRGKADWFDSSVQGGKDEYKAAVVAAMEAMARRIAARIQ
jgi:hypothetical protein